MLIVLVRRSWEPLSVVVAILAVVAILGWAVSRVSDSGSDCGFCPLKLEPIEVKPNPLVIGQPATLVDGLCNRSDKPVSATIILSLEPMASALNPSLQPLELINSMRNLDPGQCLADNPVTIAAVSDTLPTGMWRLAVRVTARGAAGEMQIIPQTSNYFEIVRSY